MNRILSIVAVTSLAIGGMMFMGCDSTDSTPRAGHDASFGGGSGEFGTSPTIAGDYPADLNHHSSAPQNGNGQ